MTDSSRELVSAALVEHGHALRGMLARQASATLLRFETPDDLYQGFAGEALVRAERFTDRGEGSARAWLYEVGRNYLRDRHRHWAALKRGSGRVVRSGLGGGRSTVSAGATPGDEPSASQTGPMTIAARREQLVLAAKALALLLPRDRQLVEWSATDVTLVEMAERLGMSPESVGKARARALDRLRKTHELVLRRMTSSDEGSAS
ncbi:sigma-70 family RNA polymerase sigma factor [Engelhardtia mirabilis]|uniref:RNA polymerase sigma factor SigX n=1 Tax=Engelhardtia mirabilis TaxID=2528011 RepID=A0A518BRD9_9BACT|nr:RNA polymerase sigma factor SigX [Planctomycetes bacterium Pla133]QDV03853.1 RNA polymerase sigma factor SigX [Planctomycetes bacterium Pla86]